MGLGEFCGFPYWDGLPVSAADEAELSRALERHEECAVVTLGSFIGSMRRGFWKQLCASLVCIRVPVVVVGAPRELWPLLRGASESIYCTGYVPLSRLWSRMKVLVHHGGIGTMYSGLFAGACHLVIPQAFDQEFNAALIADAGVGRSVADAYSIGSEIDEAWRNPDMAHQAESLRAALTDPCASVEVLAQRVLCPDRSMHHEAGGV
jgi:UDP:flavonoid glycosyltransferase YjiC (YdhE family)